MTHIKIEDIDIESVRDMESRDLLSLLEVLQAERQRRALENGDIEALIEEGFTEGFNGRGEATIPWIEAGLLVCPGSKIARSATSHDCTFVSIDDTWVWDSEAKIEDDGRKPPGPRETFKSVTVVMPSEGMKVDVVTSKAKGADHEMRNVKSFIVRGDNLEPVTTRTPRTSRHR